MNEFEDENGDKYVLNLGKIWDFDEIPSKPETSNIWMIDKNIALWFTSYDDRWRFMLMEYHKSPRRSGESFETKKEAEDFYKSNSLPTWVKGSLENNGA
jgi:hypothetical protein